MEFFGIGGRGSNVRMGLDIGTRMIKLSCLNPTSAGMQLTSFGVAATPEGSITDGVINNPEAVGEAINQILRYYNIKEKKVVASLPGRSVVVRTVTLPSGLNDREIKVAALGEVERFLPFPLDEMEYDFKTLGTIEEGETKQTSVVFIAAHSDSVQKRVEAARHGGLDSIEIDIDPFVIMRSVIEHSLFDDQATFQMTLMLVEIGASATSVSIVSAGKLRFTRIFATGGDTLTRAIESGLDITFHEAEKLKKEKGVALIEDEKTAEPESIDIHQLIKNHLENLVLEIRRSLAYYTSKYRGEMVNKILLVGGGSMLRGLRKFLEDDLEIPVTFGNPLKNITYVGDLDVETIAKRVPVMGISVGLSLRQTPPKQAGRFSMPVDVDTTYEFGAAATTGGVT
ncbi:MAG: type IV pilus assembly protein PilM [bacterium]